MDSQTHTKTTDIGKEARASDQGPGLGREQTRAGESRREQAREDGLTCRLSESECVKECDILMCHLTSPRHFKGIISDFG